MGCKIVDVAKISCLSGLQCNDVMVVVFVFVGCWFCCCCSYLGSIWFLTAIGRSTDRLVFHRLPNGLTANAVVVTVAAALAVAVRCSDRCCRRWRRLRRWYGHWGIMKVVVASWLLLTSSAVWSNEWILSSMQPLHLHPPPPHSVLFSRERRPYTERAIKECLISEYVCAVVCVYLHWRTCSLNIDSFAAGRAWVSVSLKLPGA